ncbi:MAG: hypothetical protein IPH36_19595 [Saprospiraceae bacterium]|nr:hypothetical protein [Saprospiraceae bacterium]
MSLADLPDRLDKDLQLAVVYGSKIKTVPFSIKCRDFIQGIRVPDNPSSYASEVTLIDPANGVNVENSASSEPCSSITRLQIFPIFL